MANAAISIDFIANVAQLRTSAEQSAKILSDFKGRAESLKSSLGAAFGVIAGIVGAGTIAAMAKQSIDSADSMSLLSQSTGVSVEQLSALSFVAAQNDITQEALASSVGKLSKSMVAASEGSKESQKTFSALGVNVTDLTGQVRQASDVMADISTKFASMPDGANKTATAIKLFGKSGADMIPMLNAGGDGMREMMQQAESLGLVITDKTAASANTFNDSLGVLSAVMRGTFNRVLTAVAPMLERVAVWLAENATNSTLFADTATALGGALKVVASVASVVWGTFQAIGTALGGVAAVAVRIMSGDFKGAIDTAKSAMQENANVVANTWSRTTSIWQDSTAAMDADTRKKFGALSTFVKSKSDETQASVKKMTDVGKSQKIDTSAMREAESAIRDAAKLRAEIMTEAEKIEAEFSQRSAAAAALLASGHITDQEALLARQKAVADLEAAYLKLEQSAATAAGNAPTVKAAAATDTTETDYNSLRESMRTREQIIEDSYTRQAAIVAAAHAAANDPAAAQAALDTMQQVVAARAASLNELQVKTKSSWDSFFEQSKTLSTQVGDMWVATANRFAAGVGDAVATAIMEQKSMADAMRNLTKNVISQVISGLVELGVKQAMLWALGEKQKAISTATSVTQAATVTASATPAATATSIYSFGTAAAIGIAAMVAAWGIGRALAGQAHDGMTEIPRTGTYMLEGGERVVKKDQNRDLTEFMRRGRSGGSGVTVNFAPVISAMDARGVDAVLSRHMGTIVAGVQGAYNNNGRRGGPIR